MALSAKPEAARGRRAPPLARPAAWLLALPPLLLWPAAGPGARPFAGGARGGAWPQRPGHQRAARWCGTCRGSGQAVGLIQTLLRILPPMQYDDPGWLNLAISAYLDDEWTEQAVHQRIGEAVGAIYKQARASGDDDLMTILAAIAFGLKEVWGTGRFDEAFEGPVEIANRAAEMLMLRAGYTVWSGGRSHTELHESILRHMDRYGKAPCAPVLHCPAVPATTCVCETPSPLAVAGGVTVLTLLVVAAYVLGAVWGFPTVERRSASEAGPTVVVKEAVPLLEEQARAQLSFVRCLKMNTSSGGKLADLEFGQGEEVYAAQADLANYFYHLAIEGELSEYFALPAVDVSLLRATRRAVAPKAKAGAKASAEAEPKQSAAAAEAPWVHGGGKPRRVRFREAEVVEIKEDDEADQLAAALRLLEERGVQLDEEAQKKLGVGRQADPSKAGPEAPKSHHATVQSAMWKVKNTAGKLERSQQNLEAAQEALADAQLAVDKAAEAEEAAAKAHAQAQDLLERARRVEQAGLPPEAQLDQRAQDVDRLAQATLGARYAAELKDHFEGEEAVQVTQAIELFSKLAAASKARIEAAKRAAEAPPSGAPAAAAPAGRPPDSEGGSPAAAGGDAMQEEGDDFDARVEALDGAKRAEVERFLESHGCSLPKRLRLPAGSAAGKGAAEAAEKSEDQEEAQGDILFVQETGVAPGLLSELADAIAAIVPGGAAGSQGPSEDGPEPAREADDAAPGGAPENVGAAVLDEPFDQGASAEALRGVRACYDEDWTAVVHSLKGDVLDLPPCAATESETEPAGQVSGAGQRHSDEEAVECVAKVERLDPAAGLEVGQGGDDARRPAAGGDRSRHEGAGARQSQQLRSGEAPRATGSRPRTLGELYASFAALLEEDLGGLFDMEQEDLTKCAGRGESARFQEGTISASRPGGPAAPQDEPEPRVAQATPGERVRMPPFSGMEYLFLPAAWKSASDERYPVVVFLHGMGDGKFSVMNSQSLPRLLSNNQSTAFDPRPCWCLEARYWQASAAREAAPADPAPFLEEEEQLQSPMADCNFASEFQAIVVMPQGWLPGGDIGWTEDKLSQVSALFCLGVVSLFSLDVVHQGASSIT
ncbi:unnamed protein product [Prorocentrum cordatum]|uniref:1-alkyl-2-acetylglycerophosphocholine esterase n=1 Tax=Prorocentrum cordatum TaxID=2364126 RepID=A0ABN9PQL4_9DINO|nr:unnamed protein product [Polarella glacialis]